MAAAAAAAITAVSVGSPTAASIEYPPGGFTITLSASIVLPGAELTATVALCETGVSIRLSVDGTGIQVEVPCLSPAAATINAPMTPGQYTIRAGEVGGRGRSATAQLTVATPQTPGGDLPATGTDATEVATYGAAALVLGAGLVAAARRRHLAARR